MQQHAIKEKGFSFTLEALISLMVLAAFLGILQEKSTAGLEKIYCLQKENDLIKAWIKTKNFNEKELEKDFREMFPAEEGKITVDGKKTNVSGRKGKNTIISEGFYFEGGKIKKISVMVSQG